MTELTVQKKTGTYTDVLVTLGLAELIARESVVPTIKEHPRAFTLELSSTPTFSKKRVPYRYIRTKEGTAKRRDEIDYPRLKTVWETHFDFLKEAKGNKEVLETYVRPSEVDTRTLITSLVDLLKPIENSAYNKTFDLFDDMTDDQYQRVVTGLLNHFQTDSGSMLQKEWQSLAKEGKFKQKESSVQAFNPMMGKGMNAPKANSVSMSSEKELVPLEALKFIGWWAGVVAATPKNSKDRKVLCVIPTDIDYKKFLDIVGQLRKKVRGGGVQIDVRAALELTRLLLEHHPEREEDFWRPKEAISGLHSAYFQNLGSAKGVSNLSVINLPSWVALNLNDVEKERGEWDAILGEHIVILRRLDEGRTDQYNLLLDYRDFMSAGSLDAFLQFLIAYGVFALAKVDREKTPLAARSFNPTGLRKVMVTMDETLSDILNDEGFQNVATAIRRATRGAVYAKLGGNKTYPVHYGLAQDLNRKALYKDDFIGALADFATEYNSENLRVSERLNSQNLPEEEKRKRRRSDLSTHDLAAVAKLLDTKDSKTVAKLLIAFGYAKNPKDLSDPPETDNLDSEELTEEVEA